MALQAVIKLTRAQYETLRNGGTVGDYTGIDNTKYLYFIQEETDYLPYAYWSSDHGVDNLPFGVTSSQIKQTGQYGENHSVFMYFNQVGTPFQLQIPDSSESYIYKRYYSGGSWSAWSKVNAGYADSAGDASTLQGYSPSSFLIKSAGGTLTAPLQTTSTFALTNNVAPEQSITFTRSNSNLVISLKEPTGSVSTRTTTYTLSNDNDARSYHLATQEWVEDQGYITDAVTASGTLTSDYIILGNGGSVIKASSKRIADHNTTWDVVSDSNVPTMWAISSYVSGLHYVSYSSQSLTDAEKAQARTNINAAEGTKVRSFDFHAGGQYVGWVSVAKLQLDSNNYFDYQAFDVFICRSYNSPSSESYSCNVSIGWCNASIRLVSKNVGTQIIKQLRLALDENNHRLYLQVYVDTNYSTYTNGCEMDLVGLLKSGWLAEDSVMDSGLTAVAVLNLTLGTEADTAGYAATADVANYANDAGDADTLDGHDSSYFATASSLSGYVPFDTTTARSTVDGTNARPHFYNLENNTLISGYGDYWYVINMGHYSGNNYASQIAMNYQDSISDTDMFIRTANDGTWRSWRRVLTDNNYSSYALPLSGGTVNGDVTVTGGSNAVTFEIGGNYSKGTLRIWDGADGDYIDLKADTTFNRQTLFIPNEGDEHTIATREWVTESYWADVNISASSNKGTTPTFSTVTIGGSGNTAGKATVQYNANEDCIDFVFA